MGAEGHGGDAHSVLALQGLERAMRVFDFGPAAGKFGTGEKVVYVLEDAFEAGVDGIDIDGDGDAVGAGDAGCVFDSWGVVTINVEQAGTTDLIFGNIGGREREAIGTLPEHGTFAGGLIDDDVGRLVGAAGAEVDVFEIDAAALKAIKLDAAAFVIANGADVFGAQAEFRAGDYGAGDLASGA